MSVALSAGRPIRLPHLGWGRGSYLHLSLTPVKGLSSVPRLLAAQPEAHKIRLGEPRELSSYHGDSHLGRKPYIEA